MMHEGVTEKLKITALFVEDDDELRDILEKHFERVFERLVVCSDANQGLSEFEKSEFDVLVTDIKMPGEIDGLDLAKIIKEKYPKTVVIVMSAYNDINFLSRAIDIGVDRYVTKPIKAKTLKLYFKEIDSRLEAAKELKEKSKLLSEYSNAVDVSAIVSKGDLKGRITYVNDKFCEISGYDREELLGQPHNIVRHPITPSAVFEEMWRTILSKQIWKGRITNRKKDGSRYIVETTITPILNDEGEIVEFFSIRNDVTKFVEMGRKLKKNEEERIEQEKSHLEELNKSKDMLLSIFTHELKTPLNAIINLSSLACTKVERSKCDESKEIYEYLEVVKENGKQMLQEISNILDIVKIKADKFEPKMMKFEIVSCVGEILENFQKEMTEKSVICDTFFPEECIYVTSDLGRFSQIIANIVSNAIKYSKGKIAVSICEDSEFFSIIIEDNGEGFRDVEKAVSLFAQDDENSLTRVSSGIGLGLHFVKLTTEKLHLKFEIGISQKLGGAKVEIRGEKLKETV